MMANKLINISFINALIQDSSISAYEIEQATGVTRSVIINYRNGSADFDNMSLRIAIKLQDYYLFKLDEKK